MYTSTNIRKFHDACILQHKCNLADVQDERRMCIRGDRLMRQAIHREAADHRTNAYVSCTAQVYIQHSRDFIDNECHT